MMPARLVTTGYDGQHIGFSQSARVSDGVGLSDVWNWVAGLGRLGVPDPALMLGSKFQRVTPKGGVFR